MYSIKHIIDGEKTTELFSDQQLVNFMRRIANENDDQDKSIKTKGEALAYLVDHCPNLVMDVLDTPPTKKATHRLIDSVWTIEYEVRDGKAVIHKFTREDEEGYKKERELMQGTIREGDGRTAKTLLLRPFKPLSGWATEETATETYEVANPRYIFDYQ